MSRRVFLTALFGLFCFLTAKNVYAYCLVSSEDSHPLNVASLGYAVKYKYNNNILAGSLCSNSDGSYDDLLFFDQTIRFATSEAGYPSNDVNEIIISSSSRIIAFNNTSHNIAVGNWPLVMPPDDDYAYNYPPYYDDPTEGLSRDDYGIVKINGRGLGAGTSPLRCAAGTRRVILRNLIVETNGVGRTEFFDSNTCFRDGGAVYVCTGDVTTSDPADDPDCDMGGVPDEDCDDGIDNDGDGSVDCNDSDCDSDLLACPDIETNCTNSVDDDMDGQVDCADTNCNSDPACIEDCDNEVDDDGNGQTDCADSDCTGDPACEDEPAGDEICDNGRDDDEDGLIDCNDEENCPAGTGACPEAVRETLCVDLIDNDGDFLIDCADPDCAGNAACVDLEGELICNDGVDNDENGDADCDDVNCFSDPACAEPPEVCDNEADDDGDRSTDCDDPDCEEDPACDVDGDDDDDNDDDGNVDNDGDGYAVNEGDCDDNNPTIHPMATEICDEADNDCDDEVDETCAGSPREDDDNDGYCEDLTACDDESLPGDCDDFSADVNPAVVEICDDGVDNNCDGLSGIVDPNISVPPPTDGDGETSTITIGDEDSGNDDGIDIEIEEDLNEAGFTLMCEVIDDPTPDDGSGSSGGCGCDLTDSDKPVRAQILFVLFFVFFIGFLRILKARKLHCCRVKTVE